MRRLPRLPALLSHSLDEGARLVSQAKSVSVHLPSHDARRRPRLLHLLRHELGRVAGVRQPLAHRLPGGHAAGLRQPLERLQHVRTNRDRHANNRRIFG